MGLDGFQVDHGLAIAAGLQFPLHRAVGKTPPERPLAPFGQGNRCCKADQFHCRFPTLRQILAGWRPVPAVLAGLASVPKYLAEHFFPPSFHVRA